METNSLNFFGRELPSSLGYGVLDKSSVKIENEVISADYFLECDHSVVHQVNWDKDRCELKMVLHGEFCGSSCSGCRSFRKARSMQVSLKP